MARPMVTRDPAILGGAPVVAGTRVYATTVAVYLAMQSTLDEVRRDYPTIPDAWLATLATFPVPPYRPVESCDDILLDEASGSIEIDKPYWHPDEIPTLCAALTAAAEASRQWQRDVDAWIAAHMLEDDEEAG